MPGTLRFATATPAGFLGAGAPGLRLAWPRGCPAGAPSLVGAG